MCLDIDTYDIAAVTAFVAACLLRRFHVIGRKDGLTKMGRIYAVTPDGKEVDVEICKDSETLYRALRKAVAAPPEAALRLVDPSGKEVLHVSSRVPSNTPQNRYILSVYTPNGMLVDEVNMDLATLENRVLELEKQLQSKVSPLPPVVQDLKHDVETFKHRLETTKHLSWLNCYKELPPSCRRLQYRRRSDAKQKIVREQFIQICENKISDEIVQCLRLSSFDSMQWSDEELLSLLYFMFSDLGLIEAFSLDKLILRNFLFQVYKNYNEVPFHNFRHCFCVAQMMYAMCWKADLANRIGDLEVLVLLVSCICHDLDHPGYNNIYQINARTELALRYNDISPLENHHCSIAFRILEMEESNIFKHLGPEEFKLVREGIIRCILATDMARHNEIIAQFREAFLQGFDYSNKTHINLLCMVLIKVADISNEARPMEVAEPWLDRLLQEFFTQSDAEKEEGLPVTPFMDREKITKPSSQCSFIGFVLLPLFESLCDLLTELSPMMVEPVRSALEYYRRLNEAHHKNSVVDTSPGIGNGVSTPSPTKVLKSNSNYSIRKTSITFSHHPEDDVDEVLEDLSPEEEATVTEVAVSEKTLKFKISTESSSEKKSHPGSRKGSRERYQEDDNMCDSCHRRDYAVRSRSLVEPEWKSDKRRSQGPKSPGIVSRLRKLGWRSDDRSPGSPASLREQQREVQQAEKRASTLPKVNRKRFASEARKGWRGLLRRRDEPTTSKPNGLSSDSLSKEESEDSSMVNNNRKKNRVEGSPHRQRWMASLVSSFRSKKSHPVHDSPKS